MEEAPMGEKVPVARRSRSSAVRPRASTPPIHALAPWAVAAVAVFVLAFVISGMLPRSSGSVWHAVFLTNGQVYFGHVARETSQTVVLRDVYYLQVSPSLQQRDLEQPAPPPDITLVKLGKELHGPTDEMRINREHVLFTEELRDDATVVQAIAAARGAEGAPAVSVPSSPVPPPDASEGSDLEAVP